jgi:hypothetical protein
MWIVPVGKPIGHRVCFVSNLLTVQTFSLFFARYANADFIGATSPGTFCRRQAATSFENGLACYQGLGLTQDCAKIWADTSWNVSITPPYIACVASSSASKNTSNCFCPGLLLFFRIYTHILCFFCLLFVDCEKLLWFVCPQGWGFAIW